ncbi:MAG: 3D-(3,5/4)-trihydroxycyclohexane-1,2-dione acylhydrolase (decyclizing) [Caldilineaceae bacterium]|nr:3D-(3,5/4)-trihydroxycyclohexane-1,2-dione acylhydrolase (decyclizing) [Caldilineaceae bacterium]MBP8107909.1 3D-(3,5/4)-trihydroxycyclohexane-1,2-dione acylhydrolase (decyclizing) [Caldilineaceae bacterium]MBP8123787.1 3D-(3,5/4)-trihydroxycyclohexane-1,2-dione acylhydrolase (decyclizing) [Caldilineaceae bacterium]MBP9073580.1 3D-(3,5/4)-trihydroxycyclohexane-1,2-dione acylhydrolase (decyclizing) [Caldilineaceae bacterium]
MRLTMAQALIKFLKNQYVEHDGVETPFFAGCFGIFGHGCVAGVGEALLQNPDFRYYQARNEQGAVHAATAFAKVKNRLQTLAVVTSIGPGATNMITGAATATINRLPVLLLPGDIFARRNVAPVLQQLEAAHSQDFSVNDCFKPVSKYWDRINRPDQLLTALPEAMRILTSPSETGAVTVCLPQDVQTEAFDYPVAFFRRRVWHIMRNRADRATLAKAAEMIRTAKQPMIVAGGGVIYAEATDALRQFVDATGIPVGETMAGKGSLTWDHPLNLGAIGATGTFAANRTARDADLVIGIGTRYSDFTTASKTAWQHPNVRFININVAEFDAGKQHGLAVVGDAKATLAELSELLADFAVAPEYRAQAQRLHDEWDAEVQRIYDIRLAPLPSQGELIGVINDLSGPDAIMLNAAGSMPGDLHKLWRATHPKNFHLEYGNSCMGYEIAGGLGAKMAAPDRDVFVIVGDGSYLMLSSELVTSVQEGVKLIVLIWDNGGYKSIGSLSRSLGLDGFGTRYVHPEGGVLAGDSAGEAVEPVHVDFAMNARSLGCNVIECETRDDYVIALEAAKAADRTTVVVIKNDRLHSVPGYESWWDVAVPEVSKRPSVQEARTDYEEMLKKERYFLE